MLVARDMTQHYDAAQSFDTPSSAMTSQVRYSPTDKVLSIVFRAGGAHHFANVPAEHYQGLQKAESVGKYYHAHIKGKYQVAK